VESHPCRTQHEAQGWAQSRVLQWPDEVPALVKTLKRKRARAIALPDSSRNFTCLLLHLDVTDFSIRGCVLQSIPGGMCLYRRRRCSKGLIKLNYFEQIEAIHQQVREYVEKMDPEYKVVSVDSEASSEYKQTTEIQLRFKVHAFYKAGNRHLSCDVWVLPNGVLHMGDRLVSI
jgi:hypothetical protein